MKAQGIQYRNTDQSLSKEIQKAAPVVDTTLDRTDVAGGGNGGYVDHAVIQQLLDVISAAKNVNVLRIFVGKNNKFCGLPGIFYL